MQPNNSMFPALSAVPSINLRPEVLISRESQRQSNESGAADGFTKQIISCQFTCSSIRFLSTVLGSGGADAETLCLRFI